MTDRQENKDRLTALWLTLAVVAVIVLFLAFGKMGYDPGLLTENNSEAVMMPPDDEEMFVEPELLDLGEEHATANDAPAAAMRGEPEPAPVDNSRQVVPGDNPKPAPAVEKPVTQDRENDVKATTPTVTDKEREKVTSSVAKGFAGRNGTVDGNDKGNASGGEGVGIQGSVRGRTFKGCPSPKVSLRHKTVVKVEVVVNEEGHVVSASATGAADATIRRACEQAARQATWSARKGAGDTHGSITFTITPR